MNNQFLKQPKIEFSCCSDQFSNRIFSIKNVSSVILSNMKVKAFEIIAFGGSRRDILPITGTIPFPTSLGPNESKEFRFNHNCLNNRKIESEYIEFSFSTEDEWGNVYCCTARKDVSDIYDSQYVLGKWKTAVVLEQKNGMLPGIEDEDMMNTEIPAKVFISHKSEDASAAEAVVDFLEDLHVPSDAIVCTSVPNHLIPNGEKIYDWLRSQFIDYALHVIFLLSKSYYMSPDCLNEMGAAWVTQTCSDAILLPGFTPDNIRGCIGSDTMSIYCDGPDAILSDRLRQLRDTICEEFGLSKPDDRRWEKIRCNLIVKLKTAKLSEPETEDG